MGETNRSLVKKKTSFLAKRPNGQRKKGKRHPKATEQEYEQKSPNLVGGLNSPSLRNGSISWTTWEKTFKGPTKAKLLFKQVAEGFSREGGQPLHSGLQNRTLPAGTERS